MQQLGASFINSFLLPYIKNQILGNIKNDTRLQNMFRYDKVLRPDELEGLEDDYFVDTGTVLETDAGLRKAFWKEFNEFVTRQKNLCEGNILKLTFRLLPDERTGGFSKEAQQNLEKFAFYAVNRLEDTLIQREIDQKKILGKISEAQAESDKKDLKDGKMILVRGKDGKFDYMSDRTIARAIGNVERTAKMLKELKTRETESGGTEIYTFNPTEFSEAGTEISSSPKEVQEILWKKRSIKAEKDMEDNGLYIEAHMTIDANGIAHGFAKDRNGIRLRIEFDVKKPGERVYRITFVNNPDNKFFISENEFRKRFGNEKQSALQVFREKENEANQLAGVVKARGTRLSNGLGGPIKLPENRKITVDLTPGRNAGANRGDLEVGTPYAPPVTVKSGRKTTTNTDINRENQYVEKGIQEAKKNYELRNKRAATRKQPIGGIMKSSRTKENVGKRKKSVRGKQKSFLRKVAKIYAAGLGGAIGLSGIISLFT